MSRGGFCWGMSLRMEVCWHINIIPRNSTCINRWLRFTSNLELSPWEVRRRTLEPPLGGWEWDEKELSQNVATMVRWWDTITPQPCERRKWEARGKWEMILSLLTGLSSRWCSLAQICLNWLQTWWGCYFEYFKLVNYFEIWANGESNLRAFLSI
jgi:hypothetical protein